MSASISLNLTAAGRTNTPPATLYAEVIANASTIAPAGLTVLPAGLIEDMAGTATGALVIFDQGITEALDSISPNTANPWMLTQLGQIYLGQGSTALSASNTSVYEVFTGPTGFVIAPGFTMSDGTNQYVTPDGGIIITGGTSAPIFFQALNSGSWAVPAGSVDQIVTSVPTGISLTATNPLAGTPAGAAQTQGQYRAQVMQAGLVAATGTPNYLKTLLQAVPGVQAQLIAVRAQSGGAWEIIVGGTGDPYAIALAIFQSGINTNALVGSTLAVTGITQAAAAVVTTDLNHGYVTGTNVTIAGVVGTTGANGTWAVTVLSQTTFSIPYNSTSAPAWTSGGVCTPNYRNVTAAINSYPDTYTIPIVIPPVQTVTLTVTWNTSSSNFVSNTGVAQLVQTPVAAYINSIPVGAPINLLMLNATFIAAVALLIPQALLTVLVWSVSINGIVTTPGAGTETIQGDPESYFSCAASSVAVIQG